MCRRLLHPCCCLTIRRCTLCRQATYKRRVLLSYSHANLHRTCSHRSRNIRHGHAFCLQSTHLYKLNHRSNSLGLCRAEGHLATNLRSELRLCVRKHRNHLLYHSPKRLRIHHRRYEWIFPGISSVILPVALVTSAVWPDLASKTISETAYPFTRVGCSRFEFEFWSRFTDTIRVISYVAQCFSLFFGCKVSIVRSFGTFYEFDLLAGSVSSIKSLNFVYEFYIWLEMLEGRLLQQMLGARFSLLHFSKVDLPYAGSCFVLGQARLRSFWIRLTYRCSRNYCRLHPF